MDDDEDFLLLLGGNADALQRLPRSAVRANIAPTPVVKGTEAVKIYKEANQKRSQASKNGAEKLKI